VKVLAVPATAPAFSRVAERDCPFDSLAFGSTLMPVMLLPRGMPKPKPVKSMVLFAVFSYAHTPLLVPVASVGLVQVPVAAPAKLGPAMDAAISQSGEENERITPTAQTRRKTKERPKWRRRK